MNRLFTQPSVFFAIGLFFGFLASQAHAAKKAQEVPLTNQGKELLTKYSKMLEGLSSEISAALPAILAKEQSAFLRARAALESIPPLGEAADAKTRAQHEENIQRAENAILDSARVLLKELNPLLGRDTLDDQLIRASIIADATPRGLAEFAQQGSDEAALLDRLFADRALMKQIALAGGANGAAYGQAMQVYEAILAQSERAREIGSIFQRLALGTALHMPWQEGKPESRVYGIIRRTRYDIEQVPRYLHYEKAFLEGELDPAFKDMTTWECRFITNSEYRNEDLAWAREMMRIYRPDHITMDDYKWRYVRFIKSDVPYCSTTSDPSLGSPAQMQVALGGVCGRRAFLGRLTTRAFGIPTRASTQTGHAALSHWTPDGWVICLGAWWSLAWCGPQGGLDFLLDSQAREHPGDYLKVLRAQWIGDALGEEDVSIRSYGKGGGFWDGLAHFTKRVIVKDAEVKALELVGGMKLGESDELLGDEKGDEIKIPEADRTIVKGDDGSILIPAAACDRPKNSTDKVAFMKSWDGGTQIHYARLGQRPELIRYTVEVPEAGKYTLSAKLATVANNQTSILRVNRRTLIDMPLPFTKGLWDTSKPVTLDLREGRNTLMFTCRAPNRGVTIKELYLKPVP
jgi:hypothetical protein